ncbi:DUF1294 domain-containing protein [Clostridium saccharobutylicum]|uniref:DUF1294 domain-containing protein n=1 Tax=Clostridium saccharobutylicum TaxID=169679 RepID=A0A1S8MT90_CLOSA|nr:DUF1294 domain-containing protein [Clostridium saccharobutylicum]OOM07388.1 hypothetical protein CLOSAC_39170 [Clostridium saccharobutylicum]
MLKVFLLYLAIVNLIGFLVMFIDKQRAIHKEWRIPEHTLINISIIGGSIGMLVGMSTFRHKTQHKKFTLGVPAILIAQFAIILFLLKK